MEPVPLSECYQLTALEPHCNLWLARSEPSTTITQGKAKDDEEVSQVDLELREEAKTKDTKTARKEGLS